MPAPYFSEIRYLGAGTTDFVEVAVDAGTDVSNFFVTVYRQNGSIRSSDTLDGLSFTTVAGRDVYVIERAGPSNFNGISTTQAVSLSDGGTVHSFVSFSDTAATVTATTGPANGLTSTEIGVAGAGTSLETIDYGASYYTQTTPNSGTIPCLTNGTLVQTEHGNMLVDELGAGMRLKTMDGTFKPVRKLLSESVTAQQMRANAKLYPIRICAHTLGNGLPKRDLLVSRQHRMLVESRIVKRMFGQDGVLIPAVKLLTLPGVYIDRSLESVTYFHLLLDEHEVIYAEGAPTESLLLGAETLKALSDEVLEEIRALFPEVLCAASDQSPARLIPRNKQQKNLIARHVKNDVAALNEIGAR
ncbi:MAG: Hint domain-containing protein [Paracoccaceae bacterium]